MALRSRWPGDAALAGWGRVIDEVHAAGGAMGPQIWHVGAVVVPEARWEPPGPIESPSGLNAPNEPRGIAMSEKDIADTIRAFGRAGEAARRLGFDLVEIHGAHGYLIDQFFWEATNGRKEAFGGATLKEHARFAAEVVKAMRAGVGPEIPISLRVSQWKIQDYSVRLATSPEAMSLSSGPSTST